VNTVVSRKNVITDPDPWDARSLEWMTDSPPAAHNFDEIPTVSHLDEYFHRKYREDDDGRLVRVSSSVEVHEHDHEESAAHHAAEHIHLPSPSYWPLVVAAGLPLIGYGLIYNLGLAVAGGIVTIGGIYGWGLEPSVADEPAPPAPREEEAVPVG
jgi:cytochrome c oxidase subunit 1